VSGWVELDRLLDAAPGAWSACVQRPGMEPVYTYAADVVRRAASLIKVPLALVMMDAHAERLVDLDALVTLREEDRVQDEDGWEGSFDRAPAGTQRTGWQLLDHALRESDNTASNLLIGMLGIEAINCWMHGPPLYLRHTELQRRFIDWAAVAAGRENRTTAREIVRVFELLSRDPAYAKLLPSLEASAFDDALVAGLPPGTRAAHKAGTLPGVEHDAGIVYAPTGPYIVAILSEGVPDEQTGRATVAQASHLIFKQMNAKHHQ